ncbi:MAG: sulfatase [Bacteroidales bacterium]|nr:sulfatase [Bacteroidales bacterium]
MNYKFITAALFSISLCYLVRAQKKPNIILINIDDMGYGDTEPYGMTGIPTPNFNLVAQQGLRLTHFMAAQPICSASRAALLTGCYSNRVGISGAIMPDGKIALNPEEETIASLLKNAGYKTAMIGKWHLGNKVPYFPIHYGFDSYFGLKYSNDMWPVDYSGNPVSVDNNRYTWPPLTLYNGDLPVDTLKTLDDQSALTTLYTEKAVEFIQLNTSGPFFLYLAHSMPHVPLAVSEKFEGKSELGLFGDVIMELDWSVGRILKAIDEAGISENTLLIITSDNGPWKNFGNHAGSTGGFREGKSTTWDGGNRVPCYVRWPGRIEAASINSSMMTNMDILPTIVDAAGASLPQKKIDGINFLPVWLGETKEGPREVFYYYFSYKGPPNLEGIRYKHWKLVLPHSSQSYSALQGKDGFPGIMEQVNVPLALYNLSLDPGEDHDVKDLYPEMVEKLLQMAEEAREDLGDNVTGKIGKNLRTAAFIE